MNYKRVERLYQEAQLQVRRRKRKKVLMIGERQPLLRPTAANQAWSMDFVFDRSAEGRVIKCLTIVDDATHEAVAIEVERAIFGHGVARVLDRLLLSRGLPLVIRSDNGKEVLRQGHAEVGTRPRCGAAPDRAGQAKPERLHGKLQRAAARRMPQRTLVRKPAARPGGDRTVAPGVQRGKTEESTRRANARRLCQADGRDRVP